MERTNERFGSTREHDERNRPIGGAHGYEVEAFGYGPPEGQDRSRRERSRRRRPGMFRRMAHWVGSTLQDWAEFGAEQMERAGERAREITERGGSQAQDWSDRGGRQARQWTERAGRRMENAGEEMRSMGSPDREYGAGRRMPYGYGQQSYGYGVGQEPYGYRQGMFGYGEQERGGGYREQERGGYGEQGRGGFGEQGQGRGSFGFGEQTERARFAGRGPRGYRRSDERIHEDACDKLSSGFLDASDIEVAVEDGEVTLSGEVDRRGWKRLAEDMVSDVSGVREIHNQIRVRREERTEEAEPRTYHSEEAQSPQH